MQKLIIQIFLQKSKNQFSGNIIFTVDYKENYI